MERLTRIELDDICENAGLTETQQQILRLKYFDPKEPTVRAICIELNISENKFFREQRKLLGQIFKYKYIKESAKK